MSGIHKRRGRVLVEFTADTFDELDGSPKRKVGDQVWVDPASAKSFVDIKGVAKLVEDEPEASEVEAAGVEDQAPEAGESVTEAAPAEKPADEKPEKAPAKKAATGKTATEPAPEAGDAPAPAVGDA